MPTPFPYDLDALGLSDADRAAAHPALYADFVAIVRRLRRECPWDREQTHDSVKHLTIEEAYEFVDAVDAGDPAEMQKELGDLFLHVLFHAHIAETEGTFDVADVMRAEMTKLVRRHPHVFGDEVVGGAGDVARTWEAVKRAERAEAAGGAANGGGAEAPSALDGVPDALPALLRAERVQAKAAAVGFDFPDAEGAWAKVDEEAAEVRAAETADALEDEVGDLLFAVVNYARLRGVVPETALRRTVAKFSRRFRHVEAALAERGARPAQAGLDTMDALWDEAKAAERRGAATEGAAGGAG
ncbi:nucleoside triphosphate pyrophosphohydrolase [Rubrivirga sp. S365]|uniref:Nucleoside triphosphate pyrophosphohydrolase n=1 Tax=Rubrivirga litoralis TaxID=3075598 RepID=A0ABU3BTN7_9BACT|nr:MULTISPECIES: nucleoside triphosphate pyrophosphohydrolase [unclassified Rubrivirga]MDT0632600.1 nucleoside triphosphate pyrophosphohydrolase [Rubrivirga sp. F394]MDT7856710.1 nucleoside triphosphate pyrophosphohydrolase [Rubrivirga sp. S365]